MNIYIDKNSSLEVHERLERRLERDIEQMRQNDTNPIYMQYIELSDENRRLNQELNLAKYNLSGMQARLDTFRGLAAEKLHGEVSSVRIRCYGTHIGYEDRRRGGSGQNLGRSSDAAIRGPRKGDRRVRDWLRRHLAGTNRRIAGCVSRTAIQTNVLQR